MKKSASTFGRISPIPDEWLARAKPELVIDPHLPIIDTHHHFFAPQSKLAREYLLDDFAADCSSGHNIVATVYVETGTFCRLGGPEHLRSVGETETVAGLAAMSDNGSYGPTKVASAIIGHTDLTAGRWVGPALDAHITAARGRFRGIRDAGAYDADPRIGNFITAGTTGRYVSPSFEEGMKELIARDLSLDAWVFHPQLPDVVDLARRFPDANIVAEHCGGPLGYGRYEGKRDEVFATWHSHMMNLAQCPNVTVKLGGLMMRLAAYDYIHAERPATSEELARLWQPYVETCLGLFGPSRSMVESNFPVEKMGVTYAALFNALKHIASGASESEKQDIFFRTALRVYRLAIGASPVTPAPPGQ